MNGLVVESLPEFYGFELAAAARKLLVEVMLTAAGETVVISADSRADMRVVEATAQAAHALGAHPLVIRCPSRAATEVEPPAPLAAATACADVWIDYAVDSFMYTDARAVACGAGVRYGDFMGMTVEGLVRMVGKVPYPPLLAMGERLIELTSDAPAFEIRTEAGTRLTLSNAGCAAEQSGGVGDRPGAVVSPGGSVTWAPVETSLEGTIVVDGMIWPPDEIGSVRDPVTLVLHGGRITAIDGGPEAELLRGWLQRFDSPDMTRIAHISYGFHPGVTGFVGNPGEDERLFGALDFGFGSWIDRPAPGHFDVVVRSPTIVSGDLAIEERGRYVDSELVELSRALGVPGY